MCFSLLYAVFQINCIADSSFLKISIFVQMLCIGPALVKQIVAYSE